MHLFVQGFLSDNPSIVVHFPVFFSLSDTLAAGPVLFPKKDHVRGSLQPSHADGVAWCPGETQDSTAAHVLPNGLFAPCPEGCTHSVPNRRSLGSPAAQHRVKSTHQLGELRTEPVEAAARQTVG